MSDDKKFLELTKQIEVLKEQQEVIIADYSAKVSVLSKEVKELSAQKATIEKEIDVLANDKDSISGYLAKAGNEAKEIIGAANADADAIRYKAVVEAETIAKNAELKAKEAQEVVNASNKIADEANEKVAFANKYYEQAKKLNMDAETLFADANKKINDAIKDKAKAEELLSTATIRQKAIELAEQAIEVARKELVKQQIGIEASKSALKEDIDLFSVEKATFYAAIEEKKRLIEEKEADVTSFREQLIKQKEINAFKTAELDTELGKARRELSDIRKQKSIVDNMKKELSN